MCFTWALILDCCLPQHLPVSNHYQALPIFNFSFLKSGHSSLSSSNQPIALLVWFIARVFPIGLLPSRLNHLKSVFLDIIRVINLEICVWLHSSLLLLQGFPFILRMTSKLLSRLNKAPQRLTSPSSPTTPCLHSGTRNVWASLLLLLFHVPVSSWDCSLSREDSRPLLLHTPVALKPYPGLKPSALYCTPLFQRWPLTLTQRMVD